MMVLGYKQIAASPDGLPRCDSRLRRTEGRYLRDAHARILIYIRLSTPQAPIAQALEACCLSQRRTLMSALSKRFPELFFLSS